MYNYTHERLDIEVTTADAVHSKTFTLDKTIVKILGIGIASDRSDLMYHRGTQKIEINRQVIYKENYQSQRLQTSLNTPVNDRYYKIEKGGIEPGNGQVTVEYKDNNNILIAFAPYRVSVYLYCETTDNL